MASETKQQKHTPGPWSYETGKGRNANYHRVIMSDSVIAASFSPLGEENQLEAAANAHLIAAAPELLKSLRALWNCAVAGYLPARLFIDEAEAAIKKARGEQ